MIKVEHTKIHNLGFRTVDEKTGDVINQVLVADAELVLVPCVVGIKGLGVVVKDKHYHSILISRTEKPVGDDKVYNYKRKTIEDWRYMVGTNEAVFCYKILALPEHFSPQTLSKIVSGELKDGDKVLLEVEEI